jgi:hypothetical protein
MERHCEERRANARKARRDEAIQIGRLDCFASLAMTIFTEPDAPW